MGSRRPRVEDNSRPQRAPTGQQTTGRWWSDSATPVNGNAPIKWSPERATECGQIAQPRTAGQQRSAGKWREMERNGECMRRAERDGRLMVSVTPPGFPVSGGSVYRGSAIAPPPACGLATYGVPHPRWFRLQGFRYRSTACLWSCHPYGVPHFGWFRLQGFRCRSTTCLWSCHPYGVLPLNLSVNRRLT